MNHVSNIVITCIHIGRFFVVNILAFPLFLCVDLNYKITFLFRKTSPNLFKTFLELFAIARCKIDRRRYEFQLWTFIQFFFSKTKDSVQ